VFGVCNGFQILCESGLLTGVLLKNAKQQFVCKNVFIKGDDGKVLKIPIAHGEGRFHADEKTIQELIDNKQIIYRYCDQDGNITADANPNGATHNIAGICNKERNVFGMMPHPERACSDKLGNIDGRSIFQELFLKYVKESVLA
jgi:phosphoribosylformylglycinamidine synthase